MNSRKQRLIHLLGKKVHVIVDRPIGYHHGDIVYPINYGYLPGIIAGDGEEQDAYIIGITQPLKEFDGIVVGGILRRNDCEDKLVVAPHGLTFHQGQIAEAVYFQERFFDSQVVSLFHKSCGVLPYRDINGYREYLIVYETHSHCWSLPKGHMEAGESETDTALRELREETGLTAVIDPHRRAVIAYPLVPSGMKQVAFFPGRVQGEPLCRPGEIEQFRWIREEEMDQFLFADTVRACKQIL